MPRIIYSRGFPYGAPLVMIRGGGTRQENVKSFLREHGFRWQMSGRASYAWENYMDRSDLGPILVALRDDFGMDVVPKDGMDVSYLLDLDDPKFGRPKGDDHA